MTIKASEALIAWSPDTCSVFPETAGRVRIGPLLASAESPDWADRFMCTAGAAYTNRRTMRGDEQLAAVLLDYIMLVVGYDMDSGAVHDEFCKITEYREAVASCSTTAGRVPVLSRQAVP
jgi:hypothetical protein